MCLVHLWGMGINIRLFGPSDPIPMNSFDKMPVTIVGNIYFFYIFICRGLVYHFGCSSQVKGVGLWFTSVYFFFLSCGKIYVT